MNDLNVESAEVQLNHLEEPGIVARVDALRAGKTTRARALRAVVAKGLPKVEVRLAHTGRIRIPPKERGKFSRQVIHMETERTAARIRDVARRATEMGQGEVSISDVLRSVLRAGLPPVPREKGE